MNHTRRLPTLTFQICIASLITVSALSQGCDQMAGAALEMAIENTTPVDARRDSFMAQLEAERSELPKKINDHTTLTAIEMRGLNRVRYIYAVSESGRPTVNMNFTPARKKECIDRMIENRMTVAMEKLDLGVEHFFKDSDGKCMLWITLTKNDFKQGLAVGDEPESEPAQEKADTVALPAAFVEQPAAEKETGGLSAWLPTRFLNRRDADNPAGVQSNPFVK